jgi:hypothetical protein
LREQQPDKEDRLKFATYEIAQLVTYEGSWPYALKAQIERIGEGCDNAKETLWRVWGETESDESFFQLCHACTSQHMAVLPELIITALNLCQKSKSG